MIYLPVIGHIPCGTCDMWHVPTPTPGCTWPLRRQEAARSSQLKCHHRLRALPLSLPLSPLKPNQESSWGGGGGVPPPLRPAPPLRRCAAAAAANLGGKKRRKSKLAISVPQTHRIAFRRGGQKNLSLRRGTRHKQNFRTPKASPRRPGEKMSLSTSTANCKKKLRRKPQLAISVA